MNRDLGTETCRSNGAETGAKPDTEREQYDEPDLRHRQHPFSNSSSGPPYSGPLPPSSSSDALHEATGSHDAPEEDRTANTSSYCWPTRLVISTSGLGVAMSDDSLRSLHYCLTWLRWANERLGKAIFTLKGVLREWEEYKRLPSNEKAAVANHWNAVFSRRIEAIREEVRSTLMRVVEIVSKYAGGALPENARHLVRRLLTSLPRRFQMAWSSPLNLKLIDPSPSASGHESDDAAMGGNRALVLAEEGLDILAQVTSILNDTIISAQHWCDRLGRKRAIPKTRLSRDQGQEQQQTEQPAAVGTEPALLNNSEPPNQNGHVKQPINTTERDSRILP